MIVQPTVVVTRAIPIAARRRLEDVSNVILWDSPDPMPRAELLRHYRGATGLLVMADDRIDAEIIQTADHLRVISTASPYYAHIDVRAAHARGIAVCYAPHVADNAKADMVMALLLACARHTVDADTFVKRRDWTFWSPHLFEGHDIQHNTLGIVGLGDVGLEVAHRAQGFGMRVLYYDIQRNPDAEELLGVQFGNLDSLLREADFVTLHLPRRPTTRHIMDERRLQLMKPTAYLINVADGTLVARDALVRAVREGWIAGAALDTFAEEPLTPDEPLLALSNVLLTPHIAANTTEALLDAMRLAAEQIVEVLHGRAPRYPVPVADTDDECGEAA